MRKYSYEAKDSSSSKLVKATVQADSERSAAKLLIDQGFAPITIKEVREDDGVLMRLRGRITTKDKVVFTRQLSTLIAAGLPFAQSLRTVLEQTQNIRLKAIIQDVVTSVEGGKSLHEAFAKHPDVFDKLFLALIAVGEASGTLDDALQRVATQQEKDAAVVGQIRGAMVYPVIVLVVIFGVLIFMLVTVVPQVERMYHDLHKTLPLMTQIMVSVSQALVKFWWLFLAAAGFIIYFGRTYLKTESGIRTVDNLKLNTPGLKGLFSRLYMARFARTMQTLLETGVAMLDAMRISSEAVSNTIISQSIDTAAERVKGGKALSDSLATQPHIPELMPQMIRIGEQSGRIDEMMGKTAKIYEDELDQEVKSISTSIEPILMVVLAIIAGGMVAAILMPIYQLVGTMKV